MAAPKVGGRVSEHPGFAIITAVFIVVALAIFSAVIASRPTPRNQHAAAASCASTAVEVSYPSSGLIGAGVYGYVVQITNDSDATCRIIGYPVLTSGDGKLTPVEGPNFLNVQEVTQILQGQSLEFAIATPSDCVPVTPAQYNQVSMTVVGFTGRLELPGLTIDAPCSTVDVTPIGSPVTEAQSTDPFSTLTLSSNAPNSAVAGTDLSYVVTIQNLTTAPVSLSPCPSAVASLFDGTSQVTTDADPACAGDVLNPQQTITAEVRLAIPSANSGATLKLSWTLQSASRPSIGGVLVVIAS